MNPFALLLWMFFEILSYPHFSYIRSTRRAELREFVEFLAISLALTAVPFLVFEIPFIGTLIHQMRRTGAKRGLAGLCLGGGNSVAMVVEAV